MGGTALQADWVRAAVTIRRAADEGRADPTEQRGCRSSGVHSSDLSSVGLAGTDAGPGAGTGASRVGSGHCCICLAGAAWWALQRDLWSVAVVLEWEALGRGHTAKLAVNSARLETRGGHHDGN